MLPTLPSRVTQALDEAAGLWPARVAVVEAGSGRRQTFSELRDRVADRTAVLRAGGTVGDGDARRVIPVDHHGPEGIDLLAEVLAVAGAGAVALVRNAAQPAAVWDAQRARARGARDMDPDTYQLVPTSGSTGPPKLVQLTQRGTLAATAVYRARVRPAPGDAVAVPQSLATVGALPSAILPALLSGGTAVLGHGWGIRTFLEALAEHDTVFAMAVTGWWQTCLSAPWPPLPALRVLGVGGSRWQHLVPEVRRRVPAAEVLGNYGLTETHGPALQVSTAELAAVGDIAGRPVPGIEADVRDGILWLRGDLVTPGYVGDRRPPAHRDADGWFCTGDVAEHAGDGWIRVVDRADDLVNVGGRKVYPAEVEAVVRRVPGVVDCAVVRTDAPPDRRRLAAFVVPGPVGPAAADVRRAVREGVGSHAVPSIDLVLTLPRTGSGKVDRDALRRLLSP